MNIGQNTLGSYDAHLQDKNIRFEHTKSAEQVARSQGTTDLSGLKEGSVFKGEIQNILNDKVSILLENGGVLQARLQGEVHLGVGDILLFSVKENFHNQIMLKPMFDSIYSAQEQALEKALDAAGLSPTERNFTVAKELMEAGMSLDKGSLVKILSQSMKHEGASIQTLVALNKMNIPVTEANIAQYERYQHSQHQLTGDIASTAEGMADFTQGFSGNVSDKTLLSVANQLLDIFTTSSDYGNMQQMNENIEGFRQNKEQMSALQNDTDKVSMTEEQPTDKLGLSQENTTNLKQLLAQAGISRQQINAMFTNADSAQSLLKQMTSQLMHSTGNEGAIQNLFQSAEFKKLFSDMIKNQWSLNPKSMKTPEEIDELYNRILKQTKQFQDTITANGGESHTFNQNAQNMKQNMQFMEQLNQQMFYAQMPLKLSNQNVNSELYVYADKRKLMQKKDDISVMLHLDMENLGPTDVKVTLIGKQVNARFYLNEQESVEIVANNMEELEKQLEKRGFSLTNEVIKREPKQSVNQVVDEIIDEDAERSIKRYTFDMRT